MLPPDLANAGWFVAMMLAIAFLIIVLILVCLVKRNRGGKYIVHEREAASGRHDYPDEPGFREYSQPYVYRQSLISIRNNSLVFFCFFTQEKRLG